MIHVGHHVTRGARAVAWYVRAFTGEERWRAYLDQCALQGVPPMTRRAWERHRADHLERRPMDRCC
jgi:hypothetical protein